MPNLHDEHRCRLRGKCGSCCIRVFTDSHVGRCGGGTSVAPSTPCVSSRILSVDSRLIGIENDSKQLLPVDRADPDMRLFLMQAREAREMRGASSPRSRTDSEAVVESQQQPVAERRLTDETPLQRATYYQTAVLLQLQRHA